MTETHIRKHKSVFDICLTKETTEYLNDTQEDVNVSKGLIVSIYLQTIPGDIKSLKNLEGHFKNRS